MVNLWLLSVLRSTAKLGKQRGEDAGAGAAAAVSPLEAASVICCLQSASQAGARRLSCFHLPRYFPSKAAGARQPPSGPTAAKPLWFSALIGIFLLFFWVPPATPPACCCLLESSAAWGYKYGNSTHCFSSPFTVLMNISQIHWRIIFFSVRFTRCPFLLLSQIKVLFLYTTWKEGREEGFLHEKLTLFHQYFPNSF